MVNLINRVPASDNQGFRGDIRNRAWSQPDHRWRPAAEYGRGTHAASQVSNEKPFGVLESVVRTNFNTSKERWFERSFGVLKLVC